MLITCLPLSPPYFKYRQCSQTHNHTHTHTHFLESFTPPAVILVLFPSPIGMLAPPPSLTKEINFPVPWPSRKAVLKWKGLLSPWLLRAGQITAQQKKQLHYLCISLGPLSLSHTGGGKDEKDQEMRKKYQEIGRKWEWCVIWEAVD